MITSAACVANVMHAASPQTISQLALRFFFGIFARTCFVLLPGGVGLCRRKRGNRLWRGRAGQDWIDRRNIVAGITTAPAADRNSAFIIGNQSRPAFLNDLVRFPRDD